MSWTKARSVLNGMAVLALSSLVFSSSVLAAKPRDEGEKERGRPAQRGREAERPAARQPSPTAPAPQGAPAEGTRTERVYRAEPMRPQQPGSDRGRGYGQMRRETPVGERVRQPAPQPYARTNERVRDRTEQATPYRVYQAPEVRRAPAEGRVSRPQPREESARPVDQGQRQRVVPGRPQAGQPTRVPQERERGLTQGELRGGFQPQPRERVREREPAQPKPQVGGERAFRVPKADFRGPEADRNVRIVKREDQQRLETRLRDRVREQNRLVVRPERKAPAFDVIGNPVAPGTTLVLRDNVSRINLSYTRVRKSFGDPGYSYMITPRSRVDYWDGYWDGFADGHFANRHHRHGPTVVINFYYGYYYSDPYWLAFNYPGYYPSAYHYWGWCPGWVYPSRVYYAPTDYVYYASTPYRYYPTQYVDELAAQRVVESVRKTWFDSDISSLAYHLTDEVDIRVYFDGEYDYTTTTEDYYAMTVDTLATTQTVAIDFDRPIWLSSHEFFVTGRHVFWDPSEQRQTVYVSYRFRNLGGEWYLVAVGSSLNPIRHTYRDFRY